MFIRALSKTRSQFLILRSTQMNANVKRFCASKNTFFVSNNRFLKWGTALTLLGISAYTIKHGSNEQHTSIQDAQSDNNLRLLSSSELASYFQRIHADKLTIRKFQSGPSLESLCEIHRLQTTHVHVSNYAMQDVSKMNEHSPISPYFNDIFTKIVLQKKHGYCFENNRLLHHVLNSLGYQVKFYNGHIIRNNIPNNNPQHVLLIVSLNNKDYLVDAGYGGVAPIAVIEFDVNKEQFGAGKPWHTTQLSGNKYKLTEHEHQFDNSHVEKGHIISHYYLTPDTLEGSWKPLYIFRQKTTCSFPEFVAANEQVSKDEAKTPFKNSLFETAFIKEDTRISLTQNELHITKAGNTLLWKPVLNEDKYKKYLVKYLEHNKEHVKQLGKVRDRVEFGKASLSCLCWHQSYKKRKQEMREYEESQTVRSYQFFY